MRYKTIRKSDSRGPDRNGGICVRDTLSSVMYSTFEYLGERESKSPFWAYEKRGDQWIVAADSEKWCDAAGNFYIDNKLSIDEGKDMTDKALYSFLVDGKEVFGHKLAKNSAGQWVMEIKGSGTVVAVDARNIEEVLPYTIDVQFKEGGTKYSYFNEARDLKADDFFINATTYEPGSGNYQIGRVIAVDTKSKSAKTELKYFKKF